MNSTSNSGLVERGSTTRLVVALVCVSIGFQALAFATPGDTLSLTFRMVGVLALVAALFGGLKAKSENKHLLAVGIGVVACLTAIALAVTQAHAAQAAELDNDSSVKSETVTYMEPDLNAIAATNKSLVELKGVDLEV